MTELFTQTNAMLEKWSPAARAVQEPLERLPSPINVMTGEALDVGAFCAKYYQPLLDFQGKQLQPGLDSAEVPGRFDRNTGTEIFELREALIASHQYYEWLGRMSSGAPMDRAHFLITELRAVLQYRADDGVDTVDDQRLERLDELWSDAASQNAVGQALIDYATLAQMHRDELAGLGGFDPVLIDEARVLGDQVQMHSANKIGGVPPGAVQAALELRNRIGTLLHERMQRVRLVGRFVFRHHPDKVLEVTSRYHRDRRIAAYRKRKQAEATENGTPATQEASV